MNDSGDELIKACEACAGDSAKAEEVELSLWAHLEEE